MVQGLQFDIHGAHNLILMPTRMGADVLRLRQGRLVHDGGHTYYNQWVEGLLSHNVSNVEDMDDLLAYLQTELRRDNACIPWR